MEGLLGAIIAALASTGVVGLFARGAQRGRGAAVEAALNRIERVEKALPDDADPEREALRYARRIEIASLLSLTAVPVWLIWRPVLLFFLWVLAGGVLLALVVGLVNRDATTTTVGSPAFAITAYVLLALAFVLEIACGILVVNGAVARRREKIVDAYLRGEALTWDNTREVRYSAGFRGSLRRGDLLDTFADSIERRLPRLRRKQAKRF